MKDPVFTGRDVAGALEAAARALQLSAAALRYVILDPGRPERLGIAATPARIAVLLDVARPGADPIHAPGDAPTIREVLEAVARAAGIEMAIEIVEDGDDVRVVLSGPGRAVFLERDAEALRALEHLLRCSQAAQGRRIRLECEGYQEVRDEALRIEARRLADEVRASRQPRVLGALNAYERRIVHVVLADDPDVRTFSVGEGSERRVTIALRPPVDDAGQ